MSDLEICFEDPVTRDMRMAVWRDKQGVMHRAVGANVGIVEHLRLMWTACGQKDIPANAAWLQMRGDEVTCPICKDWPHE